MSEYVNQLVKGKKGAQAAGVLLIGLGAFLIISLVSHSTLDYPNSSRSAAEGFNWGGRIGAYVSYGVFTGMGLAAYVWPLLMLFCGWNRLLYQSPAIAAYRSLGFVGMAVLFSVATGLPAYPPHMAFKLGGVLGTQISLQLLIPYLGRPGSAVLLGALFIAALVLTTDLNLRPLAQGFVWLVRTVQNGAIWVWRQPGLWIGSWRERRAVRAAERAVARAAERDEELEEDEEVGGEEGETLPAINRLPSIEPIIAEPAVVKVERPVLKKGKKTPAPKVEKIVARKKSGGRYKLPTIKLLDEIPAGSNDVDKEILLENAKVLEDAMDNFDVAGKIVEVSPGPVVTRYEVEPAAGVKVNRIAALSDDLARIMSAKGIRIQAPVPGKSVVGVEIANQQREIVYLREVLEDKVFRRSDAKLTMALGKTISGEPYVTDLTKMPHLLVAGATGTGKSVCLNSLICSILFKATPDEVRFIMVDPKVVELTMYNGIPHLLVPVITEPKKASEALKWAVAEMEARYQKLAKLGVRNLSDYNDKLERVNAEAKEDGVEPEQPMSYLVVIIDEFADLMLTAPADVETSLMGLAQKSRAVGIHIILATQRPSVNVITGVIKANFPSRIAFQVASKTDSRTILDLNGAERLLGMGDMLFLPGGQGEPIRVHGAFISGEETERLVDALKESDYRAEEVAIFSEHADINAASDGRDDLFDEAVRLVCEQQQASTSFLQRRMKVGYSRAARLMDELENAHIVGPAEGAKPRQILIEDLAAEEELTEG
ncbi:MAG: DNA translocase FtsK [Candidatus Latescibacterota bacterium]|nr:DNA translocase FtsK [Candidatus Latescibacterota bacterium]